MIIFSHCHDVVCQIFNGARWFVVSFVSYWHILERYLSTVSNVVAVAMSSGAWGVLARVNPINISCFFLEPDMITNLRGGGHEGL